MVKTAKKAKLKYLLRKSKEMMAGLLWLRMWN